MKQYLKTILSEHINSRPEYLVAMFKQLYFETAIEYKERMNSKEAAYYLGLSIKTLDNPPDDWWEGKLVFKKYKPNK